MISSCGSSVEIHPDQLQVVGERPNFRLVDASGQEAIPGTYRYLNIKRDMPGFEYYVEYKTEDGLHGIYYQDLDSPHFELLEDDTLFFTIESMDHFSFWNGVRTPSGDRLYGALNVE